MIIVRDGASLEHEITLLFMGFLFILGNIMCASFCFPSQRVCECIICLCFDDEGVRVRFSHAARYGIGGRISNNSRTRALPAVSCLLGHTHLGRLYHRAVPTHTRNQARQRGGVVQTGKSPFVYIRINTGALLPSLSLLFFFTTINLFIRVPKFCLLENTKNSRPKLFFFSATDCLYRGFIFLVS